MIVRDIKDIIGSEKEVHAKEGQWVSRRMLLKDDKMGFSFHETIIKAGSKNTYPLPKSLRSRLLCCGQRQDRRSQNRGSASDI